MDAPSLLADRIAREADRTLIRAADVGSLPDLGLDADGRLDLGADHGRVSVTFDDRLRLVARDGTGRRATPPSRSEAAGRLRALQNQARQAARIEARHLEEAMIARRAWTPDQFARLVRHPLLGHLVRRLLWQADGTYFAVLADQALVDVDDTPVQPTGLVRLAHPATVPAADLAAWQRLFLDDEICQPFPQLARETYPPDQTSTLVDVGASTRRLFGLTHQAWVLDGWHGETLTRPFTGGRAAVVALAPGIAGWDPTTVETQTISLSPPVDLTAVETSEVVRDLAACLITPSSPGS